MSRKRKSIKTQIIEYFMDATRDAAMADMDTVVGIVNARFPTEKKTRTVKPKAPKAAPLLDEELAAWVAK